MHLSLIILAQFLSGSIWFAANAAFVTQTFLLSTVQAGFIAGTLGFAFLNLSDRFSPARVFFACSLAGACFNLAGLLVTASSGMLLGSRFLCGMALAGIYPVGMKIAASWYPENPGSGPGVSGGGTGAGIRVPLSGQSHGLAGRSGSDPLGHQRSLPGRGADPGHFCGGRAVSAQRDLRLIPG
jgi:MFS transporter, DHA1 family, inner membrane transport protein